LNRQWKTVPLEALCSIELAKTPARKTERFWDPNKITDNVWLSIADLPITRPAVVSTSKEHLSDEGAALCKTVKKGTLLVSFKLTLGRLAFADRNLFTNEAIAALTLHSDAPIGQDYLYWYLTFFDWQKAAEGEDKVKGKTLNKAKLRKLPVFVPPPTEQERIVTILDEAFEAIDTAIANTETNVANARELFEAQRDSVLEDRENGWSEAVLGELVTIKHGFAFKSEFFTKEGEHVLLTPGNFYETGGYRDQGKKQKYYVGEIPDGFILNQGAFLVAMTEQAAGLLGSPIIVPEANRFLHNQRLGLVQPVDGAIWNSRFFFHVFNTRRFRKKVHKDGTGLKVRHTSPKKLCSVRVRFPADWSHQKKVALLLDELEQACKELASTCALKIGELSKLKQSILQKAFSGELTTSAKPMLKRGQI